MSDELEINNFAVNLNQLKIAAIGLKPASQFFQFRLDFVFHFLLLEIL
jgi:hypothetical protein